MLLNEPVITIDFELKGLSPLISTGLGLTPKVIKYSTKLIFSSIARNSFIKFDATGHMSFISNKSSSFAERKLVMLLKFKAKFIAVASPTSLIPREYINLGKVVSLLS